MRESRVRQRAASWSDCFGLSATGQRMLNPAPLPAPMLAIAVGDLTLPSLANTARCSRRELSRPQCEMCQKLLLQKYWVSDRCAAILFSLGAAGHAGGNWRWRAMGIWGVILWKVHLCSDASHSLVHEAGIERQLCCQKLVDPHLR